MSGELSLRNQALWQFANDGWANQVSNELDSPYGIFARISNTEPELPELVAAFEDDLRIIGITDVTVLPGHFVVRESTRARWT